MAIREIILDTETTGLDVMQGHRLIEIGCIELINKVKTGRFYHTYVNPGREVPYEAFAVHGIASEFLLDKPLFADVIEDLLKFFDDATLVIHNAAFDVRFLNHELKLAEHPYYIDLQQVIDTLPMARKKFPGAPASLDALCRRFNINLSNRTKHGALIDAELLAEVYLELCGGIQSSFSSGEIKFREQFIHSPSRKSSQVRSKRNFAVSEKEMAAHKEFIDSIEGTLWQELYDIEKEN